MNGKIISPHGAHMIAPAPKASRKTFDREIDDRKMETKTIFLSAIFLSQSPF